MCAAVSEATEYPLVDEIRRRYLNYSLSVITSRALPDVRDGLKPVQRRILYAMAHDLRLFPPARPHKSARVCGEVIGKYHPHGLEAAYESMVRMAQPWAMWVPLVDGHGNFGSLDGDPAAAHRYTEARLAPAAARLLGEIGRDTVDFRDTYDGQTREPLVLPAEFPNLLVNGTSGIAVGLATSIPPHNAGEVIRAVISLIEKPDQTVAGLMKHIQGPDFPTGGEVLESRQELKQIYSTGKGSLRVRGTWRMEESARGKRWVIVDSVPYGVNKGALVEKIADLVAERKVPQIAEVRDESTGEVRIVCELKPGADAEAAVAFLYKHTALASHVNVDFHVLVPTERPGVLRPERLDLLAICRHFLDFRLETVRRRLEHDLARLVERIHILEGFQKLFDRLDEAIKLIRKSKGKADASERLQSRFGLSAAQAEAVLEMKLYRLAQLEIDAVLEELAAKRKEAARLEGILASPKKLAALVRCELEEVAKELSRKRRTRIGDAEELPEFDPEAYVVDEDSFVVVTRDGWVKRQGSIKATSSLRLREGDSLAAILAGSTRACMAFFSSRGSAYVCRINDLPATTGYGEPIQKLFKFADGEKLVGAVSLDPRFPLPPPAKPAKDDPPGPHLLAVTRRGYGLRFSLQPHSEPSTRAGRRYARPPEGDEVLGVVAVSGAEALVTASQNGRVLVSPVREVKLLSGAGRGVTVQKLQAGDQLVGFGISAREQDQVVVERVGGTAHGISPKKYRVTGRGGRGFPLVKRGSLARVVPPEVSLPDLPETGNGK